MDLPATIQNDATWLRHEEHSRRFAEAWQRGQQPKIEDFLPPDGDGRSRILIELIQIDMEFRRKNGEAVSPSEYRERFPDLPGIENSSSVSSNDTLFQLPGTSTSSVGGPLPTVPGYEVFEEVGRGGMGVVYRAKQTAVGRSVAIKMLRSMTASEHELNRLKIEAEAIGRLQHGNIVQIHDVGEAGGRPFLAMEFVPGTSLAARIKQGPMPPRDAAQLVETLARAIHYAHTRGIVHRDLTPGNILLAGEEVPKITDFGLAKMLAGDSVEQTQTGAILGTPCYMAPEQAEGNVRLVGPRTDVYGLGAVLYAALTGQPPFQADTSWQTTRQVIEDTPAAPSKRNPLVPRDLETICLKCLRKPPHQRYGSAEELADDLQRFLNREPIVARRVGLGERAWMWARRNPAMAALAAFAFLAVTLTAAIGLTQVLAERSRFRTERDRAQSHLYDSLVSNARAQMKARDTDWWRTALDNLKQAADLHVAARDPAALRDLVADCLSTEYASFRHVAAWTGHQGMVTTSAISPDGKFLATGSEDKTIRVWSIPDGRCLAVLGGHLEHVTGVAFTPDGRRLASSCHDGAVRVWDASNLSDGARPNRTIPLEAGSIAPLDISPDGRNLAAGGEDGSVYLISMNDSLSPRRLSQEDDPVLALAFQPGKDAIAIASHKQPLRFRDLADGKELFATRFGDRINSLGFSPDGHGIVGVEPEAWGFHSMPARANATVAVLGQLHSNSVVKVQYVNRIGHNPATMQLTTSFDGSLRLWWVQSGNKIREMAVARGDFGPARTSSVDPSGRWVIAGYRDGTVRLWELSVPTERIVFPGGAPALAFLGTTNRVANPPYLHDALAITSTYQPEMGSSGFTWGLAATPDGRAFATASHDGKIRVCDAASRKVMRTIDAHDSLAWSIAYSPDGKLIASGAGDIRIWNADTGDLVRTIDVGGYLVRALAFHPTQNLLLAAAKNQTLRAFDVSTGERIGEPLKFGNEISSLAIRLDGGQLAAGSFDETVMLWDLPGNLRENWLPATPTHRLHDHRSGVWSVAYSHDGRYLASGSDNGVVLTDPNTQTRLVTLRGIEGQFRSLSFSANGEFLAAALYTRPTIVWNLPAIRRSLAEMGLDW